LGVAVFLEILGAGEEDRARESKIKDASAFWVSLFQYFEARVQVDKRGGVIVQAVNVRTAVEKAFLGLFFLWCSFEEGGDSGFEFVVSHLGASVSDNEHIFCQVLCFERTPQGRERFLFGQIAGGTENLDGVAVSYRLVCVVGEEGLPTTQRDMMVFQQSAKDKRSFNAGSLAHREPLCHSLFSNPYLVTWVHAKI
jgi:hypothetical protein